MNIEHGNINAVLFLDFKKAVDTVDHTLLLSKLHWHGITGPEEGDWFRYYHSSRTQSCVKTAVSQVRHLSRVLNPIKDAPVKHAGPGF